MASLVLGAIGGYFFGPVGFMVASAIGTLLDPGKASEGPRLTDKRLLGSSYGNAIPIIYGTMRVAGEVIWTTPLIEHKHKTGGKGGPQVTTYSYTASFDVMICESNGNAVVLGVQKIWADGNLIYDLSQDSPVDNSKVPVTFYYGDEAQLADPTEEAVLGVGNVPAYRGVCRAVFTDLDMGEFGNRIPQLHFQVFTRRKNIPWRVSSFTTTGSGGFDGWTYANGIITHSSWKTTVPANYYQKQWTLDGTPIGGELTSASVAGYQAISHVKNANFAVFSNGLTDYPWYLPDTTTATIGRGQQTYPAIAQAGSGLTTNSVATGGFIYGNGNSGGISVVTQYGLFDGGVPGPFTGQTYTLDANYGNAIAFGSSDTGHLYVLTGTAGLAKLWKLDAGMNLIHFWNVAATSGTRLRYNGASFHVYDNLICVDNSAGGDSVSLVKIDPVSNALSDYGVLMPHSFGSSMVNLINGLMIDNNGIFSLDPEPTGCLLSDIVADISERSGLVASQYDVSALTDTVPGYMISRQSSGFDNITQLRAAYFFSAVESSARVRFVKSGNAAVVSIADDDLAAQAGTGNGAQPLVTVKRTQETELPATVYVNYLNVDANFQSGTQYARRLVTHSEADSRMDLAIALSDTEAKTIASKFLFSAWLQRNSYSLSVSRKHALYEPTDVIVARGYTMSITGKSDMVSNVIQLEGVATVANGLFLSGSVGASSGGFDPPSTPALTPTNALLLDIPLVLDTDFPNGYYAAMAPVSAAGGWTGAALYKSSDGGTTYAAVGDTSTIGAPGVCTTTLGNFTGGNVFDESNSVTVVVNGGGAALVSATEAAVLDGANLCAIGTAAGWELLQFKNATLTGTQTYVLSGLLRGRKGTEWAIAGHGANEQFALLSSALNINGPFGELSASKTYKGVTAGAALTTAVTQTFTNGGVALAPYSLCQLGGGRNAALDITLNWVRRTRIGGSWLPLTDVPLSETTEAYRIIIYSSNTYATVKATYNTSGVTTLVYSAAAQTTDFGSTQATLYFTVEQVGSYGWGRPARGIV